MWGSLRREKCAPSQVSGKNLVRAFFAQWVFKMVIIVVKLSTVICQKFHPVMCRAYD